MSISTSAELLSSEKEHNLEEKNIPSPDLPFAEQSQMLLPRKAPETLEKTIIYQKNMVHLNLK